MACSEKENPVLHFNINIKSLLYQIHTLLILVVDLMLYSSMAPEPELEMLVSVRNSVR